MINEKINIESKICANRVVAQPMEGCDCNLDGSHSELTVKKYINNANNGAGIIWFEANAVCEEGRTNPRQMMMTKDNVDAFKKLVLEVKKTTHDKFGFEPLCFIQLTHSGRQSIKPMIAYRHPIYEETRPVSDENIVSDEYLDLLPDKYVQSAKLAEEAGFDGVDVKSCHGYLFQELLSSFARPGNYGGSFENRTRLYLNCFKKVRENVSKNLIVSTRLSITDMVPKPYGFGTDENNNMDLTEPFILIEKLQKLGLSLLNITLGNPYYNPHVNRPFRRGAYKPQETAEECLKRFFDVGKALKEKFPKMLFINSGLSYYREDLFEKSENMLKNNAADLIGYGRMTLAYPNFYADYLNGEFSSKKCCMACSKCTELMRAGQVSGCAIFNEYYKDLYKEKVQC